MPWTGPTLSAGLPGSLGAELSSSPPGAHAHGPRIRPPPSGGSGLGAADAAQSLPEVALLGDIDCRGDRTAVGRRRFVRAAGPFEQMCSDGVEACEAGVACRQLVDLRESTVGALGHRLRDDPV